MPDGSEAHLTHAERTIAKARQGSLPAPNNSKTWVGPGSSKLCDGCGEVIDPADREYEVELCEALTVRLHAECHHAWMAFSNRRPAGQ